MGTNNDDKEAERQAFQDAMSDTTPLSNDKTAPFRRRLRPEPLPQKEKPEEIFSANVTDTNSETGDELCFIRPGVQKRLFQDLGRGRIQPDTTVDLHGLRVHEARVLLASFLQDSWHRGFRCVRIIHGKGRGSESAQPVLKQKVDQWLPQWTEVLAYCSAPRWDGGTGAAYVLLKRKKINPWE